MQDSYCWMGTLASAITQNNCQETTVGLNLSYNLLIVGKNGNSIYTDSIFPCCVSAT